MTPKTARLYFVNNFLCASVITAQGLVLAQCEINEGEQGVQERAACQVLQATGRGVETLGVCSPTSGRSTSPDPDERLVSELLSVKPGGYLTPELITQLQALTAPPPLHSRQTWQSGKTFIVRQVHAPWPVRQSPIESPIENPVAQSPVKNPVAAPCTSAAAH